MHHWGVSGPDWGPLSIAEIAEKIGEELGELWPSSVMFSSLYQGCHTNVPIFPLVLHVPPHRFGRSFYTCIWMIRVCLYGSRPVETLLRLKGTHYGSCNPSAPIWFIVRLWRIVFKGFVCPLSIAKEACGIGAELEELWPMFDMCSSWYRCCTLMCSYLPHFLTRHVGISGCHYIHVMQQIVCVYDAPKRFVALLYPEVHIPKAVNPPTQFELFRDIEGS